MKHVITIGLLSGVLGCGVDPLIWGHLTESNYDQPPAAGVQTVEGQATGLGAGATVGFYTPGGVALADQATTTTEGGAFAAEFPASTAFVNTIVAVSSGASSAWGIVPQVPAKATVYDDSITVTMGSDVAVDGGEGAAVAFMDDLDADATAATLLLLAKAHLAEPESTLAALSPEAVIDSLAEIDNLFADEDTRVEPLRAMVARLTAGDITSKPALRPFPGAESYLDLSALEAGADYTGDGVADGADATTAAFDDALRAAIAALEFDICYATDTIRVVLVTDFNEGTIDRNCSPINRAKWLDNIAEVGRTMFITGSLHETTPNCDTSEPPCIDAATFDAASQQMGNWSPNVVPMYDDGTHGDAVAGDNLWTITFDLPYFEAASPTDAWVRIGYKYTWGTQGHLWTGTEEWPGNQRILELRDVNGDRMITRQDNFGDETTNKDKSNLRAPAKGGCGSVLWQSELNPPPEGRRENCVDDTLESQIDTDGNCELDSWPSQFSAAPITVPCEE